MKVHIWLAAALLLATAPATAGPKASVAADKGVDLSHYHSFGFASPLGTDQNRYQSVVSQALKRATQAELEARGLRYEPNNPELEVNFNARLDDKLRVSTTPAPAPMYYGRGYYGYRGGMYGTWPSYQDQTTVSQYKEGTLNIDIADLAKKQLVWEAVVTDTITQKKRDKLDATIDAYVAAAFKKYPVPRPKAK